MNQGKRARFYQGQYLDPADLTALGDYARVREAQHALGAHTWGIAIGLDIVERKLPSGEVQNIVTPGYAWDGYGRPIVVLAPAKISPQLFATFQGNTPSAGQLVKVWIQYAENETQNPAPGFESCGVDDQHARVVETYALAVGDPKSGPNDTVTIGGTPVDPLTALSTYDANGPTLYDESVPFQDFPGDAKPRWLIPLGYVRWQQTGSSGQFVARDDSGTGGAQKDSDLIRAFRQYIGLVAETLEAADGVIRLRDRFKDPDPTKTYFHAPTIANDPANPNDLVWVEGNLRVQGDVRLATGRLDWRGEDGLDGGYPTWIRRSGDGGTGPSSGRALEVAIGGSGQTDASRFDIGPVKSDDSIDERLTVLSSGHIGIDNDDPQCSLHVQSRTVIDEGQQSGATWAGFGNNTFFNGSWNRVDTAQAGASFHMSPDDSSEFRFQRIEANGSNLRSIAAIGTGSSYIREGLVGLGNDAPAAQLHIKTLTVIDEGNTSEGAWANIGQNAHFDGAWKQVDSSRAGVNLHMNPDGSGEEFRFARIEKNGANARNIAVIGTSTSFIAESRFGIGTTTPAATLDVAGRILRHSTDFSKAGTATHGEVVFVPWGSTDDWNIFVSPNTMGTEEAGSEFDNALLKIDCWASALSSKAGFTVTAQYKFRFSGGGGFGTGTWYSGTANYLLVPK